MRKTRNTLALGQEKWLQILQQTLPRRYEKGFVGVRNFWELCALPEPVLAEVAIVHPSFAHDGQGYAAEYIRRRWPDAVIVVIGEQAKRLDDSLYDHKTDGGISPQELVRLIETWTKAGQQRSKQARLAIGGALV